MEVGLAGLCQNHAALLVAVEWKFFLVVAQIPRLNMAEDLVKEKNRSSKRAQRNPVQVRTLFSLCCLCYSWALNLTSSKALLPTTRTSDFDPRDRK